MAKQRSDIPDLKVRIELLELIFTRNKLYADNKKIDINKIDIKTVEKWKAGKSRPREKTLNKFCRSVDLTISEFSVPFDNLPEVLVSKEGHNYTEEQIRKELLRLHKLYSQKNINTEEEGLMTVLSKVIRSTSKDDLKMAFETLNGYYYGYIKWIDWEKTENFNEPITALYKLLVKIDEIDENLNIIKAKLANYLQLQKAERRLTEEKWAYQGVVIPVGGNLYFILEHVFELSNHKDFTFIITRDKPVWELLGMYITEGVEKMKGTFRGHPESSPIASRILLTKIADEEVEKGEDYLMEQLGFFEPEQLKEIRSDLIKDLNRESKEGIFTVF